MLLSEHSNQEIDVLKTMFMVLIHDAVEVDAGDTYAYDETGNLSKREREVKAAERIFNILPEEQGKKFGHCGMSLRKKKHRNQNLLMPLTDFNLLS